MPPLSESTSRHEDVERAMREIARIEDPGVAGLLTGLVLMQSEVLARLEGLERSVAELVRSREVPADGARAPDALEGLTVRDAPSATRRAP
jgi:hypothetical protein